MADPRTPQDRLDEHTAPLDALDHRRLARVDRSLAHGRELRAWWENKNQRWLHEYDGERLAQVVKSGTHPECFYLTRAVPLWSKTEANYGFFDEADVDGRKRPVMGLVQQTFFDQPKAPFLREAHDRRHALDLWQADLREFVLRYLIRLTGFYETAPYVDPSRRPIESWLRPFSWCPSAEERRGGFGFSQLYYKRRDSGKVGKFREADRARIDLRRIEAEFEWLVVGIRIHDLHLRHPALGWFVLSIQDEVLAVMNRDFILQEDTSDVPGIRGRYGLGYAVLDDPPEERTSVAWVRPRFGFQTNDFVVEDSGRILGRVTMITDKLTNLVAFNPIEWSRSLMDRVTFGLFSPSWNLGFQVVDNALPGVVTRGLQPLNDLVQDPSAGPRFDPLATAMGALGSAPFDFPAKPLCISQDEVVRSLLADFVRSQLATIIATRGVWRAVDDWMAVDGLPAWVKAS